MARKSPRSIGAARPPSPMITDSSGLAFAGAGTEPLCMTIARLLKNAWRKRNEANPGLECDAINGGRGSGSRAGVGRCSWNYFFMAGKR